MEEKPSFEFVDISAQVFGKYQYCTEHQGHMYADSDFEHGAGIGKQKKGAVARDGFIYGTKDYSRTPPQRIGWLAKLRGLFI